MQVGRYEVVEELGRGGMGVVYRARDPATGREVALKVVRGEPDPRFDQEVRACAALQHESIVTLYDAGRTGDGAPFLVMELVDGDSLKDRLKEAGRLPEEEAVDVALQLCEALGHAHARGVIHRDLKPGNVMITPGGRVKLADFGLGKIIAGRGSSEPSLTEAGSMLGTPAYMSPEQVDGEKEAMGPRSDVYGLGATIYAMLTGRPPFEGETTVNLITAVLTRAPDPPSKHAPVRASLDAVVLKCLAKEPEDRYLSTEMLASDLEEAMERDEPPASASRLPVVVLLAIVVALVAILIAAMRASNREPEPEVAATTPLPDPPEPSRSAAPSRSATPAPLRRMRHLHFESKDAGIGALREVVPLADWHVRKRTDDATQHALYFDGEPSRNNGRTGYLKLDRVATQLSFEVRIDSWFGDVYLYPILSTPRRWIQVRLIPTSKRGNTYEGVYVWDRTEPARPSSDRRRASLKLKAWHRVDLRFDPLTRQLYVTVDDRPWIDGTRLPAGFEGVTAIGFHGRGWIDEIDYR